MSYTNEQKKEKKLNGQKNENILQILIGGARRWWVVKSRLPHVTELSGNGLQSTTNPTGDWCEIDNEIVGSRLWVREMRLLAAYIREFCFFFLIYIFLWHEGHFQKIKKLMGTLLSWGRGGMGFWFPTPPLQNQGICSLLLCGARVFHSHL